MIDRSQFLKQIKNQNPHLGILLDNIFEGIDGIANHLGVDPTGRTQPPDAHAAVNIASGDSHVHVTITDASQVKKNIQNFIEYSVNDPSFAQPHVKDLGASRGEVLSLPAKDGNNATIKYYFKTYSQYLGSNAQSK